MQSCPNCLLDLDSIDHIFLLLKIFKQKEICNGKIWTIGFGSNDSLGRIAPCSVLAQIAMNPNPMKVTIMQKEMRKDDQFVVPLTFKYMLFLFQIKENFFNQTFIEANFFHIKPKHTCAVCTPIICILVLKRNWQANYTFFFFKNNQ